MSGKEMQREIRESQVPGKKVPGEIRESRVSGKEKKKHGDMENQRT